MLGVVLFVLILLIYGLILSRGIITKLATGEVPEGEEVAELKGFGGFMQKVNQFFENKGTMFIFSFVAFIIGIWNLFAPDFGAPISEPGGATIVGALLPAIAMILNSAVMYPEIIEILNIDKEKKDKYYGFVAKLKGFMGVLTLILAFLHIAFFKSIIF